ncbi:MAG: O-acetyl-ADP-ribose deacetylase [Pseudomonadota bacterium]
MKRVDISGSPLTVVRADITDQRVDAIVTAANSELLGGGGVDWAVHRAAGPRLLEACRKIGGCPTGHAVSTPAFDLEKNGVRVVIHAVGPIWRGDGSEDRLLESAYRSSLQLAENLGCASIAFPAISTGFYGFPLERAAGIAIGVTRTFAEKDAKRLKRIVHVLFDSTSYAIFERLLATV